MARLRNPAVLLLLGTVTAGCMEDHKGSKPEFFHNRSLYSENQPVVQRTDFVLDLAASGDGVPASELGRLGDWFNSLQLGYGDQIFVEVPYGGFGPREDIARLASSYGMLLSEGAPVTPGYVDGGMVRVIVSRTTASVPGCPNWRQAKLRGAATSTAPNHGCSTNSNLSAMIADPNDLVLGQQGVKGGDGETSAKPVKSYRDKPATIGTVKAESPGG